jgi:hypothetical protein
VEAVAFLPVVGSILRIGLNVSPRAQALALSAILLAFKFSISGRILA